ncbi:MAG: hypothetical protein ABID04_01915 [Patescibacteria group bacterium]
MSGEDLSGGIDYTQKLIPSAEVIGEMAKATERLQRHIVEERPDFVITTGKSAMVSRAIMRSINTSLPQRVPVLNFQGEINDVFYRVDPTFLEGEIGEEARLREINKFLGRVKERHPDFGPHARIMVLDEFITTGTKAICYLSRFHQLGYLNVSFAGLTRSGDVNFKSREYVESRIEHLGNFSPLVFGSLVQGLVSGAIQIDFATDVFCASTNSKLRRFLRTLATEVSCLKKGLGEIPQDVDEIMGMEAIKTLRKMTKTSF